MEKERYKVKVSNDLKSVGVFDLQENEYVVNEKVMLLNTAHLLCDLFNKTDKQSARIKELEEENKELNNYLETDEVTKREYYQKVDKNDKAKDREIKKLKDKIKELEDYTENTANLIDKLTEDSVRGSNEKAIEVLEKVIDFIKNADKRPEYWDISQFITNQLKSLKGE